MSLMWIGQVLGLLLSGVLAQRLGIRPMFLSSAGAMVVITAAGYLMMRGRSQVSEQAVAQ
jgi:positive regulator of sigma E activity